MAHRFNGGHPRPEKKTSPVRDERTPSAWNAVSFAPPGLWRDEAPAPTVETVGYNRSSLRDDLAGTTETSPPASATRGSPERSYTHPAATSGSHRLTGRCYSRFPLENHYAHERNGETGNRFTAG